jgi:hypothetical protein
VFEILHVNETLTNGLFLNYAPIELSLRYPLRHLPLYVPLRASFTVSYTLSRHQFPRTLFATSFCCITYTKLVTNGLDTTFHLHDWLLFLHLSLHLRRPLRLEDERLRGFIVCTHALAKVFERELLTSDVILRFFFISALARPTTC